MPTKDDLSDEINEMLGTEMEFHRMKAEELEHLRDLVDEGLLLEPQIKHVVSKHGKSKLDEVVKEWEPGQLLIKFL